MQVLIPNNAPFYYDVDGAMGASVSRSFNKAISRQLKHYPNKFIGVATTPLQNIKLAIAETEYAIKELGLPSSSIRM
jgi:predicted TIM-barrel fold metal-dependent hydrolase